MLSDIIPIGQWTPDQQDYGSSGTIARNVIPNGDGYIPFQSFVAQSEALPDKCLGAYSHVSSGSVTVFAATRTKIYRLSNNAWIDVTNPSGDYNTGEQGVWQFTQYGQRVIATNKNNKVQSFLVGTDTTFSDLITAGPDVRCSNFGIINNFLVMINIEDNNGQTKNLVRWSPINNPSGDYTPSQATQADYQPVEDGNPGEGLAVISGQNYGVLFFRNAIYRMEYVGPPAIFRFNVMEENRGVINENALASNGRQTLYYNDDGFWLFNGVQSTPVGNGRVDKTFKKDLDGSRSHQIRITSSPQDKIFIVSYPSVSSPDGENDKSLIYSYVYDKWTDMDEGPAMMFRGFTPGFTLDELAVQYPNLDEVPYSLDSRFWQGGDNQLVAFNGERMGYYEGIAKVGCLGTPEARLNGSGKSYVSSVLPVFEGGMCEGRLGHRNLQNDPMIFTPYQATSIVTGEINFNNEDRYHRMEFKISGDWQHFKGMRVDAGAASGI